MKNLADLNNRSTADPWCRSGPQTSFSTWVCTYRDDYAGSCFSPACFLHIVSEYFVSQAVFNSLKLPLSLNDSFIFFPTKKYNFEKHFSGRAGCASASGRQRSHRGLRAGRSASLFRNRPLLPHTSLAAHHANVCPSKMTAFCVSHTMGIMEGKLQLLIFNLCFPDPWRARLSNCWRGPRQMWRNQTPALFQNKGKELAICNAWTSPMQSCSITHYNLENG